MKIPALITCILLTLSLNTTNAETGHSQHTHSDASEQLIGGPNGGRMVHIVEPHFEFFLRPDRVAQITFLDDNNQMIPVSRQSISLIGGDRSAPVKINFENNGEMLTSGSPLPDMKRMPIVLQIQASADAKTVREKFYLDLNNCGSCSYKEYACICGH